MKNILHIVMLSTSINLCHSNNKKLHHNTTDCIILPSNEIIRINSIPKEKLKNFLQRLDQLPYIDEICQTDGCQNIYASFDEFSITGLDNEEYFIKNRSFRPKTSYKLCGCFTTRR
ncbi:hypothetical protein EWB00_008549 [Schistosoma japonicum]|uniref:Uncharacterized protein n=1 Tax=Schistosoma japonicum TaxID=6182 RepID=A0A4Z2CPI2_SCHJA|nr:hypothetical protein EWB00_008549 [Schistosoma japonicum]